MSLPRDEKRQTYKILDNPPLINMISTFLYVWFNAEFIALLRLSVLLKKGIITEIRFFINTYFAKFL